MSDPVSLLGLSVTTRDAVHLFVALDMATVSLLSVRDDLHLGADLAQAGGLLLPVLVLVMPGKLSSNVREKCMNISLGKL